jgi:hypothetical protein
MARGVIQGLKNNKRAFVLFLLGICLGSGLFLSLFVHRIDYLYSELNAVYDANHQKYKEIMKLKEEIAQHSERGIYQQKQDERIKQIIVEVESDRPIVVEKVKDYVKKTTEPLLDKSMQWLSKNPDLIEMILQKKRVPIDEKQNMQVEIRLQYLSFYQSVLRIWVIPQDQAGEEIKKE